MKLLPESLEDCMKILESVVSAKDKYKIMNSFENEFIMAAHFQLGLWIRNEWIYNPECHISKIFPLGIHEDDQSTIILKSFWRYLRGESYDHLLNHRKY